MVKTYVLYRAAELTLERGYDYFVIMDRSLDATQEYRVSGPVRPRFGGGTLQQSDASYEQFADVTMFRGQKPSMPPNAYDARAVKSNLDSSIERPANS